MKPKLFELLSILLCLAVTGLWTTAARPAYANQPPVLGPIGDRTINEGQLLSFSLSATDPDGDALTYSAANLPAGATFDPAAAAFSWTPTHEQAGLYQVSFTATDPGTLTDSQAIVIAVFDVNRPPVLAPVGEFVLEEGQALAFMLSVSDPDGDRVTCSVLDLPIGAVFDPAEAAFSWMPDEGQAGTYEVTFAAADDGVPPLAACQTVTVTVTGRTVLAAGAALP